MADRQNVARYTQEGVSATHVPDETTHTHPRPSTVEAIERSKMRTAASDGAQATVWIAFFAIVGALLLLAVGWGVRHRLTTSAPGADPELPTAPRAPAR